MQGYSATHRFGQLRDRSLKNTHSRVITLAVVGLLIYVPTWLQMLINRLISGQTDPIFNFGRIWFGLIFLASASAIVSDHC